MPMGREVAQIMSIHVNKCKKNKIKKFKMPIKNEH
jgi:hypothetical protein